MSAAPIIIEITSQYVMWRDQHIEHASYLVALERIIGFLTDAYAPGQDIVHTLCELKKHEEEIILRGPESLLKCALIHLHALYGEALGALELAQGQALPSPLFILEPTDELMSDGLSQCMKEIEEKTCETFKLVENAVKELSKIRSIPHPTAALQTELDQLREEFEKSVIKVLIYGGAAAGKSTYLNALLGGAYLPVSASDVCTGSLIYVKHTKDEPRFEVYWRDQQPVVHSSDLSELPKYTDESAPNTRASEVSEVHLYVPSPLLKHLQFIDAPGSRDGDERRQALLDQALSEVDAFLYLLPLERGTQDYKRDLTRLEERSELSEARAYVFTKADLITDVLPDDLLARRTHEVGAQAITGLCAAKPFFELIKGLHSGVSVEDTVDGIMPALKALHRLDRKQGRRLEDALNEIPQELLITYVREVCRLERGLLHVIKPILVKRVDIFRDAITKAINLNANSIGNDVFNIKSDGDEFHKNLGEFSFIDAALSIYLPLRKDLKESVVKKLADFYKKRHPFILQYESILEDDLELVKKFQAQHQPESSPS